MPPVPNPFRVVLASFALGCAALLAACGGGGTAAPAAPVPPASAVIAGTAAFGAAVANATVKVTDRAGASVCANDPVTTDDTGAYRCTLVDGAVAPFAILVTDPEGLINPMISILDTAPAAGSETTANVTPLTTAIAAQLDVNKDPFALVTNPAALADLNVSTLNAVKANVVAQLAQVLADAGVDVASFDPIRTPFTGGNRTGVDKMLDQVRVTFDNGAPQLSNALNPDAPAVPMADASTSTPQTVSTSAVTSGFALSELDIFKTELEKCFAVPSTSRATTVTSGVLDDLHADCLNAFTVQDTPNVDGPFKNNGYGPELFWHGLMTNPDMDGARFNLPELMRYIKRDDGKDEALVNLKFRDKNGYIDNRILLAKKFAGSRASGSQWWLYGNQRPVDAYIRAAIRKVDQNIDDSVLDGTDLFSLSAPRDRYETGLEIFIRRNNAGTNNPNVNVHYVKVTGPGLPDAGIVYANVQNLPQSWMGILNTDGTIPMGTGTYANNSGPLSTSSNIFLLQRTRGITGTAAYSIRPNPGVGNVTPTNRLWAHPTMYGASPASDWSFDLSQVKSWSRYTFEVYDGTSSSVPVTTFSSPIVTPVMPAAYAATQQWHNFTQSSFAFVTDGAAAVASVDIAWTINTLAERVGSVNAYSFGPNGQANSASLNAPKGATSVTAAAASGSPMLYNPVSNSVNSAGRTLQIRHQMLDGSYKDHMIRFN